MTSLVLYQPQCGQARWGSFISWHFGQPLRPAVFSESWVRRALVLRLEWRRLGFGITFFLVGLSDRLSYQNRMKDKTFSL